MATPMFDNILSANQQSALADQVTAEYKSGTSQDSIIAKLIQTPTIGPHIENAIVGGAKPADILAHFGGQPLTQFQTTDPAEKVKQQSFLTNVGQGASNAVSDLGSAAQQLGTRMVAGGLPAAEGGGLQDTDQEMQTRADAGQQLQQQQAAQAAREGDPARQALMHTVGGNVGNIGVKAAPYIAAGALAPEGAIPAVAAQGLAGALSGATTPTTGPGQLGKNIGLDAALGAATQGAGSLVAKGSGALANALTTTGADTGKAAAMTAAGLTPTLGTTSPLVSALVGKVAAARDAMTEVGKTDTVRAALKTVGVDGTDLSPTNLNQAKANIWGPANESVAKVGPIAPTPAFTTTLAKIGTDYTDNALSTLSNPKVGGIIQDITDKAATGQLTGTRALDYLRDTKDLAFNADNTADRTAFKAISSTLSDTLSAASPDGGAALAKANGLHPKLMVLQDLAGRAKDELPTIQQFATSNSKFADQNAVGPFSDLIQASKQAYGTPAGSTGRYGTVMSALGSMAGPAAGAGLGALVGGEHSAAGAIIGASLETAGAKTLASALKTVMNKPVSAGVRQAQVSSNPRLRAALGNAMVGGTQAGVQAVGNPQQ